MDLLFYIALLILIIVGYIYKQKQNKTNKNQGVIYESPSIVHIAGHPDLQPNDLIKLQIKNNNTINLHKVFKKQSNITDIEIPIDQLTRYEIKTESQIQKDVTLTRLLALGVLAFGVKKKTEINNTYLVLSYIQNGVQVDCLFKNWTNNQQLGDIISTINRLKIEKNKLAEQV